MSNQLETRHLVRAIIGFGLFLFLTPAVLFIAAGTVDWPMAWAYVALALVASIGSRVIVWRRNPDTLRERARFTASEGAEPWDRILVMVVGLLGPLAMMVVAGLDHRYGWSTGIPEALQYLALLGVVVGFGVGVWAMVVNSFFSAVARLQEDRGQVVVTTGPYRIVRHPSYAGALVAYLAIPVMLESLWALAPTIVMVAVIVVRTALEDRMLREGLHGYESYTKQTRYRLIPGLW